MVFEVTGRNPLLDIALELERIALQDEYFIARKLYPNVDFYSGLIYQAMGFPVEMFPVLFAIPRTAGWIAQWDEMLNDPEQKIARPRQLYVGADTRDYVPPTSASKPEAPPAPRVTSPGEASQPLLGAQRAHRIDRDGAARRDEATRAARPASNTTGTPIITAGS